MSFGLARIAFDIDTESTARFLVFLNRLVNSPNLMVPDVVEFAGLGGTAGANTSEKELRGDLKRWHRKRGD